MEVLTILLTYLAVPLTGIHLYIRICKRMRTENINNPPTIPLFCVLSAYGGLLMVILVAIADIWSTLMSIMALYTFMAAPLLILGITVLLFPKRKISIYHKVILIAGVVYLIFSGVVWSLTILISSSRWSC
jgi:hypothetical protein